ncbi:hypothetical protein BUALT_Bualt14G0049400 [Buddleja alternifolia]|uniref:EF-hand domain-containing protein n=1 Tax=Buddleja alternifolia TaxID=168488 RepID=A0AAV6WP15_9LAMI|nr:hypothetical protein BUALT_Bualt14G0049400 [Buddleja alternifolia]
MDGMRKIARAYYAQASKDEKNSIQKFFKNIDANGDGKVSLVEFKKSMGFWLSDETIFRQLDTNDDGTLDFDEVLALYYMKKKIDPPKCDGCSALLVGSYFSCWLCFGKANTGSTDLCCSCYHRGTFEHKHALSNFLDNHSFVKKFRIQTSDAQRAEEKKEMDELRMIAKAHYRAGSPEVQALAHEFFKSMDTDGDGRVDLQEFLTFIREEGYTQMRNPYFFEKLDEDGNGTLDFFECFKSPQSSYTLCSKCYQSTECKHNHNGRVQFLDNYTLLATKRDPASARATDASQNKFVSAAIFYSLSGPTTAVGVAMAPPILTRNNILLQTLFHGEERMVDAADVPTAVSLDSSLHAPLSSLSPLRYLVILPCVGSPKSSPEMPAAI